jgi:hypothetical protein
MEEVRLAMKAAGTWVSEGSAPCRQDSSDRFSEMPPAWQFLGSYDKEVTELRFSGTFPDPIPE